MSILCVAARRRGMDHLNEAPSRTRLVSRVTTVSRTRGRGRYRLESAAVPAAFVATWLLAGSIRSPWLALGLAIVGGAAWALARRAKSSPSGRRLGQYILNEKIGEGGMGVVYKASHALLQRPAAIKLLAPGRSGEQDLKRFEREVQLTSLLTHPNSISIYDFGRSEEGTFYYAMEYVDGVDLQTLVERDGPQDPARVAHLLAQLAGALVEAHQIGLIHRDVKPANIMVCERGGAADFLKLLDFGLIKELCASEEVTQTDPQRLLGTPLYLSPEALTAPDTIDARSDLYAVGAVGYFLLTGVPPFSGRNAIEVCGHHLHTAPVPPSSRRPGVIPAQLESILLRCLAKTPEGRPATAAALQRELLAIAADWTQERAAGWWSNHTAALAA
jgi:serine/threonine protein kinase